MKPNCYLVMSAQILILKELQPFSSHLFMSWALKVLPSLCYCIMPCGWGHFITGLLNCPWAILCIQGIPFSSIDMYIIHLLVFLMRFEAPISFLHILWHSLTVSYNLILLDSSWQITNPSSISRSHILNTSFSTHSKTLMTSPLISIYLKVFIISKGKNSITFIIDLFHDVILKSNGIMISRKFKT